MSASPKQSFAARFGWFSVGGALSLALNWSLYSAVHYQLSQPRWIALGVSLTIVTAVFSTWNYFINFRTSRAFHDALVRYLAVVVICYVANYLLVLSGISHFGRTKAFEFLVLGSVQVLVSGAKFLLYHWWVYPPECSPDPTAEVLG